MAHAGTVVNFWSVGILEVYSTPCFSYIRDFFFLDACFFAVRIDPLVIHLFNQDQHMPLRGT